MNSHTHTTLITILALAMIVGWSGSALAVKPNPTPPGHHLNITEVLVDLDADTVTIKGEDLDFGGALDVTLGDVGSLVIVGVPTDTQIVAGLPPDIPDGDYLLTVSRGNGQSHNDEYDLTIGAGPQGEQGPPGQDGTSCTINGTTVSCNGTSADVEGPQGDTGDQGPPGAAGTSAALPNPTRLDCRFPASAGTYNSNPFKECTLICQPNELLINCGALFLRPVTGGANQTNIAITNIDTSRRSCSIRMHEINSDDGAWALRARAGCLATSHSH